MRTIALLLVLGAWLLALPARSATLEVWVPLPLDDYDPPEAEVVGTSPGSDSDSAGQSYILGEIDPAAVFDPNLGDLTRVTISFSGAIDHLTSVEAVDPSSTTACGLLIEECDVHGRSTGDYQARIMLTGPVGAILIQNASREVGCTSYFTVGNWVNSCSSVSSKVTSVSGQLLDLVGAAAVAPFASGLPISVAVWVSAEATLEACDDPSEDVCTAEARAELRGSFTITYHYLPAALRQCMNGFDDDGDGLWGYPADPGCESPLDDNEFDHDPDGFRHEGATAPTDPSEGWFLAGGASGTSGGPVFELGTSAWSVDDFSTAGGITLIYFQTPDADERSQGAQLGWTLASRLRVVDAFDAPDHAIHLEYNDGTRRYIVFFGSTPGGEPIVGLYDGVSVASSPQQAVHFASGYHDYELVYDPVTGIANLYIDGGPAALPGYTGFAAGGFPSRVQFGSAEGAGTGHAHYQMVDWAPHAAIDCDDGVDNDGDGLIDLADDGCLNGDDPSEAPDCWDGLDNDGDGGIDWGDGSYPWAPDTDCNSPQRVRETARACGLGLELVLALPALRWLRGRRRRRS